MKKSLFLLLVFITANLFYAQDSKIRIGVTANIHHANIYNVHDYSKGRIAPGFGAYAMIPVVNSDNSNSGELYIQPQVEFTFDGERAKPSSGEQKFKNDYIAIPVFVKYYFKQNNSSKAKWFLQLGPQIAFNISQKTEGPLRSYDITTDNSFNKFDFGVVSGFGCAVNDKIEAFFRFDKGFAKVYDEAPRNYTTWNYKLAFGFNYHLR